MARFRRMKTLQKFSSVHASVQNHFSQERHLVSREIYKERRSAALAEWGAVMASSSGGFGLIARGRRQVRIGLTAPAGALQGALCSPDSSRDGWRSSTLNVRFPAESQCPLTAHRRRKTMGPVLRSRSGTFRTKGRSGRGQGPYAALRISGLGAPPRPNSSRQRLRSSMRRESAASNRLSTRILRRTEVDDACVPTGGEVRLPFGESVGRRRIAQPLFRESEEGFDWAGELATCRPICGRRRPP